MSTESKSATKTCIVGQGRRKIHTTFANDEEMVEEYDMKTDELVGTSIFQMVTGTLNGIEGLCSASPTRCHDRVLA